MTMTAQAPPRVAEAPRPTIEMPSLIGYAPYPEVDTAEYSTFDELMIDAYAAVRGMTTQEYVSASGNAMNHYHGFREERLTYERLLAKVQEQTPEPKGLLARLGQIATKARASIASRTYLTPAERTLERLASNFWSNSQETGDHRHVTGIEGLQAWDEAVSMLGEDDAKLLLNSSGRFLVHPYLQDALTVANQSPDPLSLDDLATELSWQMKLHEAYGHSLAGMLRDAHLIKPAQPYDRHGWQSGSAEFMPHAQKTYTY